MTSKFLLFCLLVSALCAKDISMQCNLKFVKVKKLDGVYSFNTEVKKLDAGDSIAKVQPDNLRRILEESASVPKDRELKIRASGNLLSGGEDFRNDFPPQLNFDQISDPKLAKSLKSNGFRDLTAKENDPVQVINADGKVDGKSVAQADNKGKVVGTKGIDVKAEENSVQKGVETPTQKDVTTPTQLAIDTPVEKDKQVIDQKGTQNPKDLPPQDPKLSTITPDPQSKTTASTQKDSLPSGLPPSEKIELVEVKFDCSSLGSGEPKPERKGSLFCDQKIGKFNLRYHSKGNQVHFGETDFKTLLAKKDSADLDNQSYTFKDVNGVFEFDPVNQTCELLINSSRILNLALAFIGLIAFIL